MGRGGSLCASRNRERQSSPPDPVQPACLSSRYLQIHCLNQNDQILCFGISGFLNGPFRSFFSFGSTMSNSERRPPPTPQQQGSPSPCRFPPSAVSPALSPLLPPDPPFPLGKTTLHHPPSLHRFHPPPPDAPLLCHPARTQQEPKSHPPPRGLPDHFPLPRSPHPLFACAECRCVGGNQCRLL